MSRDGRIFRKVDPGIWDDEKFIALDEDAQSIFLLLLTGPQTCSIPGLQLSDVHTLASARRWDAQRVQRALGTLCDRGMVELDSRLRVVRLPNAPRYNAPDNPSVLLGWWKEYQRLPNSPLKRAHVASIKAAVAFDKYPGGDGKDPLKSNFRAAWDATFGTIDTLSDRVSLHPVAQPVATPCATSVSSEQRAVRSEKNVSPSARARVDALQPKLLDEWTAAGLSGAPDLTPAVYAIEALPEAQRMPTAECFRLYAQLVDARRKAKFFPNVGVKHLVENISTLVDLRRGAVSLADLSAQRPRRVGVSNTTTVPPNAGDPALRLGSTIPYGDD